MLLLFKFVEYVPLKILECLSSSSSFLFTLLFFSKRNQLVKRNIKLVFPYYSNKEVIWLMYKFFRTQNDYIYQLIKQKRFSDDEMIRRCKFVNLDVIKNLSQDKSLFICYSGHMLNYEWFVSLPLNIPNCGMGHLYYSGNKNRLTSFLCEIRNRYGSINIPSKSPIKPLLKVKIDLNENKYPNGFFFGTLADMTVKGEKAHYSSFFGKKLKIMTGSERIGRKFNMTFVYAHIKQKKRGFFEIDFMKMSPPDIDTNPYAYTDEFVRLLENNIREQPELWLMWGNPYLKLS